MASWTNHRNDRAATWSARVERTREPRGLASLSATATEISAQAALQMKLQPRSKSRRSISPRSTNRRVRFKTSRRFQSAMCCRSISTPSWTFCRIAARSTRKPKTSSRAFANQKADRPAQRLVGREDAGRGQRRAMPQICQRRGATRAEHDVISKTCVPPSITTRREAIIVALSKSLCRPKASRAIDGLRDRMPRS